MRHPVLLTASVCSLLWAGDAMAKGRFSGCTDPAEQDAYAAAKYVLHSLSQEQPLYVFPLGSPIPSTTEELLGVDTTNCKLVYRKADFETNANLKKKMHKWFTRRVVHSKCATPGILEGQPDLIQSQAYMTVARGLMAIPQAMISTSGEARPLTIELLKGVFHAQQPTTRQTIVFREEDAEQGKYVLPGWDGGSLIALLSFWRAWTWFPETKRN